MPDHRFQALFGGSTDLETEAVVLNHFQRLSQSILMRMVDCQKQTGGCDCGLFAIAIAIAEAFNASPTAFNQASKRPHLARSFEKGELFPSIQKQYS